MLTATELCDQLMKQYPSLKTDGQISASGIATRVSSVTARQLVKDGIIFAVKYHGIDHYPLFQFDERTGKPREIIKDLLAIFSIDACDAWDLFIWLTVPTGLLGGSIPLDLMDLNPKAVIEAARRERMEPEF